MGIPGIYEEIGRGERVSLSKLAIEKYEETGRPLRIAIDVSIWQFQIQAGQGGSNPAIRTLYYRLIRLLATSIQPLFVFDGPKKPQLKRNKRVGNSGASASDMATKLLLKLFGFPFHNAPGEAEAECALLQRNGIVDAVLSEDVDTLMFGSGITLRDWSSEGSRGNKSPTHVSLFDAKKTKEGKSGLDREGMILVALLSGGDYNTDGLPGFGIKVACQAARAGYGKSLCILSRSDEVGLATWRNDLSREIQTNESKFFKSKHKSLMIPDTFPNKEILGYYTHPVVSSVLKIERLKEEIVWDGEVDVPGLREYVKEAFDWTNRGGARKFIRNLAPALLVHRLRLRANRRDSEYGDLVLTAMNEMEYVRSICGRRQHFSVDGMPELRVIFHPLDIVGLSLDDEYDDSKDYGRDGLAPVNDDDQIDAYVSDEEASAIPGKRAASIYDPTKPDRAWIPETIAKVGVPLKVEDYEEAGRIKKLPKVKAPRAPAKNAVTKGGMPKGALDKFVRVSRPRNDLSDSTASKSSNNMIAASQCARPPVFLAPSLERLTSPQPTLIEEPCAGRSTRSGRSSVKETLPKPATTKSRGRAKLSEPIKSKPNANPWSLSIPIASSQAGPTITKTMSTQPSKPSSPRSPSQKPVYIDSSPPPAPSPPRSAPSRTNAGKHNRSPSPPHSPPLHSLDYELNLASTVTISRGTKSRSRPAATTTPSKSPTRSQSRPSPRKKVSPSGDPESSSLVPHDDLRPHNSEHVARRLSISALDQQDGSDREDGGVRLSTVRIPNPGPRRQEVEQDDQDDDYGECPSLHDLLSPAPAPAPASLNTNLSSSFSSTTTTQSQSLVINLDSSPEQAPRIRQPVASSTNLPDSERRAVQAAKEKKGKRYIMLRESLVGAWKEVDEQELMNDRVKGKKREGAWRLSEVELLDLSHE